MGWSPVLLAWRHEIGLHGQGFASFPPQNLTGAGVSLG